MLSCLGHFNRLLTVFTPLHDFSEHFSSRELACPCCGESQVDSELLRLLERVRDLLGRPVVVNSVYRCIRHNREVGGVVDSAHIKGLAADIRCYNSIERFALLLALVRLGVNRIGIYKGFVHFDIDPTKPAGACWLGDNIKNGKGD